MITASAIITLNRSLILFMEWKFKWDKQSKSFFGYCKLFTRLNF